MASPRQGQYSNVEQVLALGTSGLLELSKGAAIARPHDGTGSTGSSTALNAHPGSGSPSVAAAVAAFARNQHHERPVITVATPSSPRWCRGLNRWQRP